MTPLGQSVVIGSCHETANVVNNRVGDHNLKRKECVHEQLVTVVSTKRCKTDSCQCGYSVCGEGSIVPNVGGEWSDCLGYDGVQRLGQRAAVNVSSVLSESNSCILSVSKREVTCIEQPQLQKNAKTLRLLSQYCAPMGISEDVAPNCGCHHNYVPVCGELHAPGSINNNCCSQSTRGMQNVECAVPHPFGFEGTIRGPVILDFQSGTIDHDAISN